MPFGIVGGRIYHVITTPEPYFGAGGHPLKALYIWEGGLGIWGAIALGALGGWIGARRHGVPFLDYIDAAAPGVAVAQALGRWGNWFNNELYGRPTDAAVGPDHPRVGPGRRARGPGRRRQGHRPGHLPADLPLRVALVPAAGARSCVLADRRWALRKGQLFGLYVIGYPVGRIVFELMRTDFANKILGVRVNVWTSILVFLLGVAIVWFGRRREVARPASGDVSTYGIGRLTWRDKRRTGYPACSRGQGRPRA